MELLHFVFLSFWTFSGTVVLLSVLTAPLYVFFSVLAAVLGVRIKS